MVLLPRKTSLSKDDIRKFLDLEPFDEYRQKAIVHNITKEAKEGSSGSFSVALNLLKSTGKTMEVICEACALLSQDRAVIVVTHHQANAKYIGAMIQNTCTNLRIPIYTTEQKPRFLILDRLPQPQDLLLLQGKGEVVHLVDPI